MLGAGCGTVLAICPIGLEAAEVDITKLPAPATVTVDYDHDIRPVLESTCLRCHGPERPRSNFRLDNRASALQGGKQGKDILPGDSAHSPLIHYVAGLVEDMEMPPTGKGQPLTPEQVALFRAWIDQGVAYPANAQAEAASSMFVASPIVGGVIVHGDAAKFREHWWMPDGVSGGVSDLEYTQPLGNGAKLSLEGRAIGDSEDYRLRLALTKNDLGFVRAGYEQFRKWCDDLGGYYAGFNAPPVALGRDLHLDTGRAWIEVGLALPDYPKMTLGYEYQYRSGEKSTLEWGLVQDPASGNFKNLYPAFEAIDEKVHVIRFDLTHDIYGFGIEDNFRGEFYDSRVRDMVPDSAVYTLGGPSPSSSTVYANTYHHFQGANTIRIEKQATDWLFLSGGYLYSQLEGDAGFSSLTTFSDPTVPPLAGDVSNEILLRQRSHVFNFNAQLGPFQGLSLSAGFQDEWTRQDGFGNAVMMGFTTPYSANLDKHITEERFGLRYTQIPCTVLYAEAGIQQEQDGQHESVDDSVDLGQYSFLRFTVADAELREYRAGFTVSPWERISVDGYVKRSDHHTDYNHITDTDAGPTPGNGYPAFILFRDLVTDEADVKMVVRWTRWLKTTMKFQIVATDYTTQTDPIEDPAGGGALVGGGALQAGNYDAQVYSLGATLTPWRRLFFSTTFSYSDSRTKTGLAQDGVIVPYKGDIYTLLTSATLAVDARTDLRTSYSFSKANYPEDAAIAGVPLGLVHDRHGLTATLTHHWKRDWSGSLQYGFFTYNEPTSGGAANYTAHAVFASLRKTFK